MEQLKKDRICWNDVENMKDCMLTYLLYKEGKDVQLIARIRNRSVEQIKRELVEAKSEVFQKKNENKSLLDRLLEIAKPDRQAFLTGMKPEEKISLGKDIYRKYHTFDNPEDKMMTIWIIGELGMKELLNLVHEDIKHPHGNVRRLACSAINKIGDKSSIEHLCRALMDSKPQVRQYAAKALERMGDERALRSLNNLLHNPKEKPYVMRAYTEAIKAIETRRKS